MPDKQSRAKVRGHGGLTPRLAFANQDNIQQREHDIAQQWDAIGLYQRMAQRDAEQQSFVLHDGPLFSYAGINFDQLFNRLLKDFIVRFRSLQGYAVTFVPGWDTHALAVEIMGIRSFYRHRATIPRWDLRRRCEKISRRNATLQRRQFRRLGVLGDWQFPYLTHYPAYEATVMGIFRALVEQGLVYRATRPVHWCPDCRTSLSDAELEEHDEPVNTALIAMPVLSLPAALFPEIERTKLSVVIRTDRPWMLPGLAAVAAHPARSYALVRDAADREGFAYFIDEGRVEELAAVAELTRPEVLGHVTGWELAETRLIHPLRRREIPLLIDEATPEEGSGYYPVAPDHDDASHAIARRHHLALPQLVDARGLYVKRLGRLVGGRSIEQVEDRLLKHLDRQGVLLAHLNTLGRGRYCWRCHHPVFTRALPHWFINVQALAARLPAVIEAVKWLPAWGKAHMREMAEERPDWCISRQRVWGIPIPVFHCLSCGEPLLSPAAISRAETITRVEGSDAWFDWSEKTLLPEGTTCPACGSGRFRKETDTFDVWFESACSPFAALQENDEPSPSADLVAERHDQFRGWLQGSLLAGLAAGRGEAPYRTVLAHGFVIDHLARGEKGGEIVITEPMDLVKRYGADVLRLWAASVDAHADVHLTEEVLAQAARQYRRLRGVAHFLLGHLDAFSPEALLPLEELPEIDRMVLDRLARLSDRVAASYEAYTFQRGTHAILDFCGRELSGAYFSAIASRLRRGPNDPSRLAAQTTLYHLGETLARLLAPTVSFLAEELWQRLPGKERAPSVQLSVWPEVAVWRDDALAEYWEQALAVRAQVNRSLALARDKERITDDNDEKVIVYLAGETRRVLESLGDNLADLLRVRAVNIEPLNESTTTTFEMPCVVQVQAEPSSKCARCGHRRALGAYIVYPKLCTECAAALTHSPEATEPAEGEEAVGG